MALYLENQCIQIQNYINEPSQTPKIESSQKQPPDDKVSNQAVQHLYKENNSLQKKLEAERSINMSLRGEISQLKTKSV